jgi:hypothetical protein
VPRQAFDYVDLGGGINKGAAPAEILTKQMSEIENFYPYSTVLRRRGGHRAVSEIWPNDVVTSLFTYRKSTADPLVLCGGQSTFGRLVGTTIETIFAGDVALNSLLDLWCFFQYKDYAYAMRPASGRMIRIDADVTMRSGIDSPTIAPTIAQGAVGNLPAGVYRTVYTYYNRATGIESNPSPESNALTLAALHKIDYTGILTSPNPFVDSRRIYRTLENQVGVYFFVAQIDDNLTTTYTGDNVVVADLGRTVSFNNGTPPDQAKIGVVWQERCFCSDGRDLFYSEPLMVEAFGDESLIPVFPDDGHSISGLHAFGDRLIIAKTNKIHYLVGASPASFGLHTLTDRHGCLSHHSIQSAEGNLFWYASGKQVVRSDGTNVSEVGNPEIKPYLDEIVDDSAVFGIVFPSMNWYLLALPTGITLVYNYRFNTWTVFKTWNNFSTPGGEGAILYPFKCLADYYDLDGKHSIYAAYTNSQFIVNVADPTFDIDNIPGLGVVAETSISARLVTKEDSFDSPGMMKFLQQLYILLSTTPAAIDSSLASRLDLGITWGLHRLTEGALRVVPIDTGDRQVWRAYRLSGPTKPNTLIQVEIIYPSIGSPFPDYHYPAIDIQQLHFEVNTINRHPRLR